MGKGIYFNVKSSDPIVEDYKQYGILRLGKIDMNSIKSTVDFYLIPSAILPGENEIFAVLHRPDKDPIVFVLGDKIATHAKDGFEKEEDKPDDFISAIAIRIVRDYLKDTKENANIKVVVVDTDSFSAGKEIDIKSVTKAVEDYSKAKKRDQAKEELKKAFEKYLNVVKKALIEPFTSITNDASVISLYSDYLNKSLTKSSIDDISGEDFEQWLQEEHPEIVHTIPVVAALNEVASTMKGVRDSILVRKKNAQNNVLAVSLYGDPGTGKTMTANFIKEYLNDKSQEIKNLIIFTPDTKVDLNNPESIKHDLIGSITLNKGSVEMNFGSLVTALFGIVKEAKKRDLKFAVAHVLTVIQEANLSSGYAQLVEIMRALGDDFKLKIPIQSKKEEAIKFFEEKGIHIIKETDKEEDYIVIDLSDLCGAREFKGAPENRPPLIGVAYNFLFTENYGRSRYGVKDKTPADMRRIKFVHFDIYQPDDPNLMKLADSLVNDDMFLMEVMRYSNVLSENDEARIAFGQASVENIFKEKIEQISNVVKKTDFENIFESTKKSIKDAIKNTYTIFYNMYINEQAGLVYIPTVVELYSKFIQPLMYQAIDASIKDNVKENQFLSFNIDSYFKALSGNELIDPDINFREIEGNLVLALDKPAKELGSFIKSFASAYTAYLNSQRQQQMEV